MRFDPLSDDCRADGTSQAQLALPQALALLALQSGLLPGWRPTFGDLLAPMAWSSVKDRSR